MIACVCECTRACSVLSIQLFVTPWTIAHQVPLSMGFPRQEYWNGLPLPSPGDRILTFQLNLINIKIKLILKFKEVPLLYSLWIWVWEFRKGKCARTLTEPRSRTQALWELHLHSLCYCFIALVPVFFIPAHTRSGWLRLRNLSF